MASAVARNNGLLYTSLFLCVWMSGCWLMGESLTLFMSAQPEEQNGGCVHEGERGTFGYAYSRDKILLCYNNGCRDKGGRLHTYARVSYHRCVAVWLSLLF